MPAFFCHIGFNNWMLQLFGQSDNPGIMLFFAIPDDFAHTLFTLFTNNPDFLPQISLFPGLKNCKALYENHFLMKNFNPDRIRVVGFDADDTLWVNEPYYRETEEKFCGLMKQFGGPDEIQRLLFEVEMNNMELYGYGTKAFMLSLIETAVRVSDGKVCVTDIQRIIDMGKEQIAMKNALLPNVRDVLEALSGHYRLIVATKGDLLDQERKLKNSGIAGYFHHIEIMTDKTEDHYRNLLNHLDIPAEEFLMVGNSLKSDVLPVICLGGHAIHVPFHVTWKHELLQDHELSGYHYYSVKTIKDLMPLLGL